MAASQQPHHSTFTDWLLFLMPNQQSQSTEGIISYFMIMLRLYFTNLLLIVQAGLGPQRQTFEGVQIPTREGAILRAESDQPRHARQLIYSQRLSRGQHRYSADADLDVLDGVHMGATRCIRLKSVCGNDAALRQITLTTCSN